jgi:hypothetical protein
VSASEAQLRTCRPQHPLPTHVTPPNVHPTPPQPPKHETWQTEFTEVSAYLKEVADLLGGGLMRTLSGELANEYEVRF